MRATNNSKRFVAVAVFAAMGAGLRAEAPNVSGFVDMGYNYNLNEQATNGQRAFDAKSNSFILQNAKVGFDGKLENSVGYKVDLMYGHDAAIVNGSEDGSPATQQTQFNLEQAYVSFPCPITGAAVTVGKFVTPFGFEVVEAKDNYNISRGLLFSKAVPFSHTGVKADKSFADGKINGTLGIVNGWDRVEDSNRGKTGIAQVSSSLVPNAVLTLGGAYGTEQATADPATGGKNKMLVDAIMKVTPCDKMTLIANYDVGEEKFQDPSSPSRYVTVSDSYQGLGLHANYQINDMISVAGRWETFDFNGKRELGATEGDVLSSDTLTVQAKKDGVIYRVEYRADHSTTGEFSDKNGAITRYNQATIGGQVIVTF